MHYALFRHFSMFLVELKKMWEKKERKAPHEIIN